MKKLEIIFIFNIRPVWCLEHLGIRNFRLWKYRCSIWTQFHVEKCFKYMKIDDLLLCSPIFIASTNVYGPIFFRRSRKYHKFAFLRSFWPLPLPQVSPDFSTVLGPPCTYTRVIYEVQMTNPLIIVPTTSAMVFFFFSNGINWKFTSGFLVRRLTNVFRVVINTNAVPGYCVV